MLLCTGCDQAPAETDTDDKQDLIDQAPAGQTSFGLELGLINQFSYALWSEGVLAGSFDESVLGQSLQTGELALLGKLNLWLDVSSKANLPPVIDLSSTGFTFALGEYEVVLRGGTDLGQLAATAVIAIKVDIDLEIEDGRVQVTPHFKDEDIHIDLKVQAFAGLNSEAIESVLQMMAPDFANSQLRKLENFPIPSMEISGRNTSRTLGLSQAVVQLSPEGAIMRGTLGDVNPHDELQTVIRRPAAESAPALGECTESAPGLEGLEGDCCMAGQGICTDLDPNADGIEESFCPTGAIALRQECPSAPTHVKCCIYPTP